MNVLALLQSRFEAALAGLTEDPSKYSALVKATTDPKFGDYQANMAMALGKELGKPPREVAAMLVERLKADDLVEKPEIAGPGFINLRIKKEWLGQQLRAIANDER